MRCQNGGSIEPSMAVREGLMVVGIGILLVVVVVPVGVAAVVLIHTLLLASLRMPLSLSLRMPWRLFPAWVHLCCRQRGTTQGARCGWVGRS